MASNLNEVHFDGCGKIAEYLRVNSIRGTGAFDPIVPDELNVGWEREILSTTDIHIISINIIGIFIYATFCAKVGLNEVKHMTWIC